MKPHLKTITIVIFFSIAMAALESAVVVYLRALYYHDGFTVALKLIDQKILSVEVVRELATLLMLWTIGMLAGKNFKEYFAYFLLSFGVWDIFYYVWLKLFINWPASWFEWDILFLIPVTWLGPVLAPIICSVTMILFSVLLLRSPTEKIKFATWFLLLTGCSLILVTFMQDYALLIWRHDLVSCYPDLMNSEEFVHLASHYLPNRFNWSAFWLGEGWLTTAVYMVYSGIDV